jgi:SAM-dependent methyltransferase
MQDLWAQKIYTREGFVSKPFLEGAKALDVGCGGRKLPGSAGMDILALPGVDIVHDVDVTPWPIKDGSYDLVFLNHALEHVKDVVKTMDEIHRVLKPGGRAVIQVPYFRSIDAYTDPTHKHFFTSRSLDYFIAGTQLAKYHYSKNVFSAGRFWFGWPHDSHNPLRRAIKRLSHRRQDFYDKHLSRLTAVRCLTWELQK